MRLSLHQIVCAVGVLVSCHTLAADDPEPGMWEISADMAVPSTPGFRQDPIALRQCLSATDARDPSRLLTGMANPGASNCSFTDKRETPGHTDFAMRCEGLFAISGRGSVDYTPGTMQGRLNFTFSGGASDDTQRVESVSRIIAKRIGTC